MKFHGQRNKPSLSSNSAFMKRNLLIFGSFAQRLPANPSEIETKIELILKLENS